uniref:Uncharacterized protein n=1 Tax=Tanacetum cinerariifolium TaxID=118510 RepID=A0A6L2JS95_TANCI|nr:hypothetical protein [Tanacetum cinerariifolium]
MAALGSQNIVARWVTDDLIAFSGGTTVSKYMKLFIVQKIAKRRHFVNRMHDEVETVRGCIGQLTVVVAELQAMVDQDKVHDILLAVKDAKRGEESKLSALNKVIVEALADIETLEMDQLNIPSLNRIIAGGFRSVVAEVCLLSMGPFLILDKLTKVIESSRLTDKMKVVFDQARTLATELEALGEKEDAVRALESMKKIISRDSVMLADLEQLLARAQVGLGLKDGYLDDVEEKAYVFVMVVDFFRVDSEAL